MPPNPAERSVSFIWVAHSVWLMEVDGFWTGRMTAIHWELGSHCRVGEARCQWAGCEHG